MNELFAVLLLVTLYMFPGNGYLSKELAPIKQNVARIDTITIWTNIKEAELDESTERGVAKFYYLNGRLQKVTEVNYGETGQTTKKYYLFNEHLSFVLERHYIYDRPIYWDSTHMLENNDTAVFDMNRNTIEDDSSYFDRQGKLIHQANNVDCGSPFSDEYLFKEQKRIHDNFNKLLKL